MQDKQNSEYNSLEKKFYDLEKKMENKLDTIYKHKVVQLTLKILILSSISALIFFRSGQNRDISLWIIGIYILLVSILELLELEELRFFLKDKNK